METQLVEQDSGQHSFMSVSTSTTLSTIALRFHDSGTLSHDGTIINEQKLDQALYKCDKADKNLQKSIDILEAAKERYESCFSLEENEMVQKYNRFKDCKTRMLNNKHKMEIIEGKKRSIDNELQFFLQPPPQPKFARHDQTQLDSRDDDAKIFQWFNIN